MNKWIKDINVYRKISDKSHTVFPIEYWYSYLCGARNNTLDYGRGKIITKRRQWLGDVESPRLLSPKNNLTGEEQECYDWIDRRLKLKWAWIIGCSEVNLQINGTRRAANLDFRLYGLEEGLSSSRNPVLKPRTIEGESDRLVLNESIGMQWEYLGHQSRLYHPINNFCDGRNTTAVDASTISCL